ncbi:MAG: hypothetical protein QOI40_5007, partial [Alphaproteobacteria bacterium]|nr:hypothetical protein [Alphaproteobacteria bacterium]
MVAVVPGMQQNTARSAVIEGQVLRPGLDPRQDRPHFAPSPPLDIGAVITKA